MGSTPPPRTDPGSVALSQNPSHPKTQGIPAPDELRQRLILRLCCNLLIFRKMEGQCCSELLWALLYCTLFVVIVLERRPMTIAVGRVRQERGWFDIVDDWLKRD
ncbi:hypothetical protein, partial [Synechococcus sp. W55.1]|uniref:hypothetical protein n=1 Tax=Synechococcus sp. W55.1 TaxID=2964512 RepID=UPI0039C3FB5F